MKGRDYEKEVIDYLMNRYPIRKVWCKPELKQITKYWDIRKEYNPLPEDIDDMLEDIFSHFKIDFANYDPENYFDCEYALWQKRPTPREKRPFTVEMIIESAKAGRWLYD